VKGEAVWLSHAIGCDHRMWDGVVPHLSGRFRVLAIDSRGHGSSPVPPRPWSLEDMADDVARALDRLGIDRVHWVGLSMGGMVGQAFALRHPSRLGKLVLANTTASYGPGGAQAWADRIRLVEQGGLAAIRDMVEQRYFSEAFRREHADRVEAVMDRFMETPAQGYLGCCDAIKGLDYAGRLKDIASPTLVIAGESDLGTPVAMHEALAAGIPGATLVVLPKAAHLSAAEMPDAFADATLRFL
jgi:3-oxoadipate enol-lactonase